MMKHWLAVLLIAALSSTAEARSPNPPKPNKDKAAQGPKIALDGVVILGDYRVAYLNVGGMQMDVRLGETVDEWRVDRIVPRQVLLRNDKNEELPLSLTTSPPPAEPPKPPPAPVAANPFAAALQNQPAQPRPAAPPPKPGGFQPRRIPDEEIPEGHRRVRTPFGDVLVKDNKK